MNVYSINLTADCLEVLQYTDETLTDDLEFFDVKNPEELQDDDFRIFMSEAKAESFLKEYIKAKNSLVPIGKASKQVQALPAMLLRQRYMPLIVMGLKTMTVRDYLKRDWKIGQQIRFHDQRYTLPVTLTGIQVVNDDEVEYHFKY